MKINCYPVKMDYEEAMEVAHKKGSVFGKMMLMNKQVSEVKLLYVEYKIINYEMIHEPSIISKIMKKKMDKKKQKVRVIGNGTTGGASLITTMPEIETIDVKRDIVQHAEYGDDRMINRGKSLIRKVVRRRSGGFPEINVVNTQRIYRPFYIAYYGDLKENTKVQYIPIPADGCKNQRGM
jgi:hypothetical protein